jgi:transcription initiation factor IIE alpha subunit
MSLAGCNFFCNNEKCQCYQTGFTLTSSWPLGDIEEIIEHTEDEDLKKVLTQKKLVGIELAKITYPDPYDIPVINYVIEKFCVKCKRIQAFEEGMPCPYCGDEMAQMRWYVNRYLEESSSSEEVEND